MSIEKILVVDDEALLRTFLEEVLTRLNYAVTTAENGKRAFEILKDNEFDLVITDMKMPTYSGIDVLKKVKELYPQTPVIIATAYGSIENVVEAMQLGAHNYILKPFAPDTVEAVIKRVEEHHSLVEENKYLRQEVSRSSRSKKKSPSAVVAKSAVMKDLMRDVETVADSQASVFIRGESGTGKEVIASAIHNFSSRADKPFIRVNCAAIPESLIESEFFGHEKGAFTGAQNRRLGRFELANGGTLLLDEVTEIPINLQAKLLRVLQERELERVGGSKTIKVDVRIISTSNRDMQEAIEERVFREDLYYRLNVVPIILPSLRERAEDIIPLTEHYLEILCQENHKPIKSLSTGAKKKLCNYSWPGNIRELINVIERTVVIDRSEIIKPEHLFLGNETHLETDEDPLSNYTLQELERRVLLLSLKKAGNQKALAAKELGLSLKILEEKLKSYSLDS